MILSHVNIIDYMYTNLDGIGQLLMQLENMKYLSCSLCNITCYFTINCFSWVEGIHSEIMTNSVVNNLVA